MANEKVMSVRAAMKYSKGAGCVFLNFKLGNSQNDMANALKIVKDLKSRYVFADVLKKRNGKGESVVDEEAGVAVIFSIEKAFQIDGKKALSWANFMKYYETPEVRTKILDGIFKLIENYGYTINPYDKKMVYSTPYVIQSFTNKYQNADSSNTTRIMNQFFNHINDPKVQEMLNSIVSVDVKNFNQNMSDIGKIDKGSAKDVLSSTALSPHNTIWILAQWLSYGKRGIPTIIATPIQWLQIGRSVINGTYPLFASMPKAGDNAKQGEEGAMRRFNGLTRNQASQMDAGVKRSYNRFANFQSDETPIEGWTKVVYFDISDTEVVDNELWDEFYQEARMENMSHAFNEKARGMMSDDELADMDYETNNSDDTNNEKEKPVITDNKVNIELTKDAIIKLTENNPIYDDTIKLIKKRPDDISSILRSFFSHDEFMDRLKDNVTKSLALDMCVSIVEVFLKIGLNDAAQKWDKLSPHLNNINEVVKIWSPVFKLTKSIEEEQRKYVMSENKMINEEEGMSFEEFVSYFGETPESLQQKFMQKQQQEQMFATEGKKAKKTFSNIWNRIIDANNKNHGVI